MDMADIPFGVTDWAEVPPAERSSQSGSATWRTREFGGIRVRMVEYSPGYIADHWCSRGHILLVLEGSLTTELANGEIATIKAGAAIRSETARSRTARAPRTAHDSSSSTDADTEQLSQLSTRRAVAHDVRRRHRALDMTSQ
jgi:hypothetical protein